MLRSLRWWSLALVLLLTNVVRASDPVGVYALVDRVSFVPSEANPERIVIHGAFIIAEKGSPIGYQPARVGWLYYSLPTEKQDQAKAEWNDLKNVAGTKQVVAFGTRHATPLPTVRTGPGPQAQSVTSWNKAMELIRQLDDNDQSARDRATDELATFGEAVERGLQEESKKAKSPEVKARLERLLARVTPDTYTLGWGMMALRRTTNSAAAKALTLTPLPTSPLDGMYVTQGNVVLAVKNVARENVEATYMFEIESTNGDKERSPAIAAGAGETRWNPSFPVVAGKSYAWRVWAVAKDEQGPVVSSTFRGVAK